MTARSTSAEKRWRVTVITRPPWKTSRHRRMSRHGRAIAFVQKYCRPPKGKGHGKPIRLATFQKEFWEEGLADNVDVAILSSGRGNGKSSGGGALAAWAVFDDEDAAGAPQVPVLATTIGQAIRSVYGVAVAMIEVEPELSNRCRIFTGVATPRVEVPFNRGELFPVSHDVAGAVGLDYSLAIIDEVGFQPMESFTAISGAAGKRDHSTLLGLGHPGPAPDNTLAQIRREIHERGAIPGVVFREYATPAGYAIDDREGWQIANPALGLFLRESAIEKDLRLMPEGLFRMYRLGQHIEGTESWLGPNAAAIWDGLYAPWTALAEAPTWVGLDFGYKRDSAAVVIVQRRPDGKFHAWAKLWVPTRDQPVDALQVMKYLRDVARFGRVEAIAYDPRFFEVPADVLRRDRLPMVEVKQSVATMTPVLDRLLAVVKGDGLRHGGDRALRQHVLNAKEKPNLNGQGFTLEKLKSTGKIDACIALALAIDQALKSKPRQPRKPRIARGF